jgi:hypothetical protein
VGFGRAADAEHERVHLEESADAQPPVDAVVGQPAVLRLPGVHDAVLIGGKCSQPSVGTHGPSPSGHADRGSTAIWLPKR